MNPNVKLFLQAHATEGTAVPALASGLLNFIVSVATNATYRADIAKFVTDIASSATPAQDVTDGLKVGQDLLAALAGLPPVTPPSAPGRVV